MSSHTFGKKEKLCSKLMMDKLFRSGGSFKEFPFRVIHIPVQEMDVTAKVLITVPKKRFRKAVHRNKIKRQIREAYRLNKNDLLENWRQQGKYFALAFVYIGNRIPVHSELNETMQRVLHRLKSV